MRGGGALDVDKSAAMDRSVASSPCENPASTAAGANSTFACASMTKSTGAVRDCTRHQRKIVRYRPCRPRPSIFGGVRSAARLTTWWSVRPSRGRAGIAGRRARRSRRTAQECRRDTVRFEPSFERRQRRRSRSTQLGASCPAQSTCRRALAATAGDHCGTARAGCRPAGLVQQKNIRDRTPQRDVGDGKLEETCLSSRKFSLARSVIAGRTP